jgi:hypothetical protein
MGHTALEISSAVLLLVIYGSVNVRPGLVEGHVLYLPRGTERKIKCLSEWWSHPNESH